MRLEHLRPDGELVVASFQVGGGLVEIARFKRTELDGKVIGVSEVDSDAFRHHCGSASELRAIIHFVVEFFDKRTRGKDAGVTRADMVQVEF